MDAIQETLTACSLLLGWRLPGLAQVESDTVGAVEGGLCSRSSVLRIQLANVQDVVAEVCRSMGLRCTSERINILASQAGSRLLAIDCGAFISIRRVVAESGRRVHRGDTILRGAESGVVTSDGVPRI